MSSRLSLAREYLSYGFTTLRDLGSMDPEFPTVDLHNALDAGLVQGPQLIVAAHIISASAGHGDLRGFYASRWELPVSAIADGTQEIRRLVRREHAYGSDWIKTANAGGYFSVGDPARPTWFDEIEALCSTAQLLGMPVDVQPASGGRFGAGSPAIRQKLPTVPRLLIGQCNSGWPKPLLAPDSARRMRVLK